jgi:pSer/pThr/pTyr-binding forkhead associated (FHA) protein
MHIDHPELSRHHARFLRQGDDVLLQDLNSRNGTFVNGRRVDGTVRLQNLDRIEFAGIVMVYHSTPSPPPGARSGQSSPAAIPGVGPQEVPTVAPSTGQSAAAPAPTAALEAVVGGPPALLVKIETRIGRNPANDLVVPDPQVSARHAIIQNQSGHFVLFDLESTNGTYVNGRRLTQPCELQPGDEIRIGERTYFFRRLAPASGRLPGRP